MTTITPIFLNYSFKILSLIFNDKHIFLLSVHFLNDEACLALGFK